jgi:cytochrome c556
LAASPRGQLRACADTGGTRGRFLIDFSDEALVVRAFSRSRKVTDPEESSSRPRTRAAVAIACAAFLATVPAAGFLALAEDQRAASTEDVIFARKALKDAVCDKMANIERMIAFGRIDLDEVHAQADAISVMLLAFPHLFPPGSDQWKPDTDQDPAIATLASPELWREFPDFYRQAAAAAKTAFELSRADKIDDAKMRARELRIACDTCHALYLEDQ